MITYIIHAQSYDIYIYISYVYIYMHMMYYSQLLRGTDMKNKMPIPSAQVRRWCDGPAVTLARVGEPRGWLRRWKTLNENRHF